MGIHLDAFIRELEPELRVGGAATLDELYNLACAIRTDLELLAPPDTTEKNV
jgi:hypothetical protein